MSFIENFNAEEILRYADQTEHPLTTTELERCLARHLHDALESADEKATQETELEEALEKVDELKSKITDLEDAIREMSEAAKNVADTAEKALA